GADRLEVRVLILLLVEAIGGPRKRRNGAEPADVVDVQANADEAPAAAPEGADAADAGVRGRVVRAHRIRIDAGSRARVEGGAAQRIQRRDRAVDVNRGRPVEREIDVFLVFVLPEQAGVAARSDENAKTAKSAKTRSLCEPGHVRVASIGTSR